MDAFADILPSSNGMAWLDANRAFGRLYRGTQVSTYKYYKDVMLEFSMKHLVLMAVTWSGRPSCNGLAENAGTMVLF